MSETQNHDIISKMEKDFTVGASYFCQPFLAAQKKHSLVGRQPTLSNSQCHDFARGKFRNSLVVQKKCTEGNREIHRGGGETYRGEGVMHRDKGQKTSLGGGT